jgi:CRISPR system Cascade subunit CasA
MDPVGDGSTRFDLVEQPWLVARDLRGRRQRVSILGVFERAHELAGLYGDVPTQTFALTRMLLAVLHGALDGPADLSAWQRLWHAERLPTHTLAEYLHRLRHRFDLFHPSTPFLQVAGLRTATGRTSELSKLIADVPNGIPFFTTRLGGELSLSYAEAARWLVHVQAWDPSGIKSGAVGDERVVGGKGYSIGVAWSGLLGGVLLEGATLRETLLLNLLTREYGEVGQRLGADRPAWEREPVSSAEEVPGGREPTGPVDLYTWQSRRVRLFASGGRVTRVLICNGERVTPRNRHRVEPHSGWRRSPAQEKKLGQAPVYMPRELVPDRAIWRGLHFLLPAVAGRQASEAPAALAPGVLDWFGHLVCEELIDDQQVVRVRAIGMVYGSNSAVVDDIVDDAVAVRAVLARPDAELAQIATSCAEAAENAVRTLGNLAGDLAAAAGGEGSGVRGRVMEQAFAELDAPYRRWLADLGSDSDGVAVQIRWHQAVRAFVQAEADRMFRRIGPACWGGREVRNRMFTAAHAEARFARALRAGLPYASFPDGGAVVGSGGHREGNVVAESVALGYGPVGTVVDRRAGVLQARVIAGVPSAVADLARLRRGMGTQPGEVRDIVGVPLHEAFLERGFAPDDGDGGASASERAARVALTLFALHQQSQRQRMHRRGVGLGAALRRLAAGADVPGPVARRFRVLATAESLDELDHHLRGAVRLLRAETIALDYALLADQLVRWQRPSAANSVRLRWGREFYRLGNPAAARSIDPGWAEPPPCSGKDY